VSQSSECDEEQSTNVLVDKFGQDAMTSRAKTSVGIKLEQNQIDILNESWRCNNPEKNLFETVTEMCFLHMGQGFPHQHPVLENVILHPPCKTSRVR